MEAVEPKRIAREAQDAIALFDCAVRVRSSHRGWRWRPAATRTPKRGGTLTYMIPADAPPSFDGHRESTYATVHSAAPFYSVLIRVNPENPADTTHFVCDLCTEMPQPTDDGKTYTFKIRDGRQIPRRLAADRRRCRGELATRSSFRRRAC